ncbi:MerR family transcriptional regulator, partial [Enterococcus avium]|uniref:MerR family transcriptional regulator n=2 Tax=Enterococcus TaxID=1350 RepID=UPI0020A14D4E
SHLLVYRKEFLSLKLFHPRVEARGFLVSYAPRTKLTKVINKIGYREYSEADIEWLRFIYRLKQTGMALETIQQYSELRRQGDQTIEERLKLLATQRNRLLSERRKIDEHLNFLEMKQATYKQMLTDRDQQ